MDTKVNALTEHQTFTTEFILLYKQLKVLWCQSHPNYRNRAERKDAYEILLNKSRQYFPEVNEDFVRLKIESMRNSFRKEHRKVISSRNNAKSPNDIHKPSLWYYNLLLFTAGEEKLDKQDINQKLMNRFWNRTYTATMIEIFKNYPCLYLVSHPHYRKKIRKFEAIKEITQKLIAKTGKLFQSIDVKRKLTILRGQFFSEYRKIKKSQLSGGEIYKPILWCYESLTFLIEPKEKLLNNGNEVANTQYSSNSEDEQEFKMESDSGSTGNQFETEYSHCVKNSLEMSENDDIYDTIAKNVAFKLREMTKEQCEIAQKLVNDIMYHGQMENLTQQSRLILEKI